VVPVLSASASASVVELAVPCSPRWRSISLRSGWDMAFQRFASPVTGRELIAMQAVYQKSQIRFCKN
jgi:hypothetical protein